MRVVGWSFSGATGLCLLHVTYFREREREKERKTLEYVTFCSETLKYGIFVAKILRRKLFWVNSG